MRLFNQEPNVYHNFSIPKKLQHKLQRHQKQSQHCATCLCRLHVLSPVKLSRLKAGKARYLCTQCGSYLQLIDSHHREVFEQWHKDYSWQDISNFFNKNLGKRKAKQFFTQLTQHRTELECYKLMLVNNKELAYSNPLYLKLKALDSLKLSYFQL